MDRLTGKDELGYYVPRNETLNCLKQRGKTIDRLAEYEDTGLSPEEIENTLADFSAFLCYMTNGRMSNTNYTVEAMRSEADNCIMEMCNDCGERQLAEKVRKSRSEGRLIVIDGKDANVPTNADRIRAMTDEELCYFLLRVTREHTCSMTKGKNDPRVLFCNGRCENCVEKWLQQQSEGGEPE